MGFPRVVKTRSRERPVDFRYETASGIEGLINFREDPTNQGVIAAKTLPVQVLLIPIICGMKNEPGQVIPFIVSKRSNFHIICIAHFSSEQQIIWRKEVGLSSLLK
jgi:hypothetical protein